MIEKTYMRFGKIPRSRRSINFRKLSLHVREDFSDHLYIDASDPEDALKATLKTDDIEKYLEKGLSVFEIDDDGLPKISNLPQARSLAGRLDFTQYPIYKIEGIELAKGQDGEPVIQVLKYRKINIDIKRLIQKIDSVLSKNYRNTFGTIFWEKDPNIVLDAEIYEFTHWNYFDAPNYKRYPNGTKYLLFCQKEYSDPINGWDGEYL